MARQQKVDWGDEPHLDNGEKDNWGRLSQDNGIAEEANGRLFPSNGVENGVDSSCANGNVFEGENPEDDVDGSVKGGGVENEEGQMSQVKVPKSLHSSNILGLSQETDSDADSIR